MPTTMPQNSRQKGLENREKILQFLQIHTYSNIDTIMRYLEVNSRSMISRHLKILIETGYVRKAEISNSFGRVTLFGITRKAIEDQPKRKTFSPHRINLRTLEHTLYCQKASVYFLNSERAKKYNVKLENVETGNIDEYGLTHRPDLLLKPEDHPFVCVEVELSLKSQPRYNQILSSYCDLISENHINQVVYVFYDERKAKKFEGVIKKFRKYQPYKYAECHHKISMRVLQ